jgi:uncharacterized protein (DUF362 family)
MIFKQKADNIDEAAYSVTSELIKIQRPSIPVLIKPNLVEPSQPPTTTDVRVVEGIISALRNAGIQDIIVAEGSGTGNTGDNFALLGYSGLNAELVDLDREKSIAVPVDDPYVWKEIMIPEIILNKFIISVPVLKEHSMCGATISFKNMIGVLPEKYYSGYWTYKKSQVHKYDTHGCIADLIGIVRPDWAVVDASIGMKGSHLSGTPVHPPVNIIYGSNNPLEADQFGCGLLGRDWQKIKYLQMIVKDLKIDR